MSRGLTHSFVRFRMGAAMALLLIVTGCGKRTGEVSGTVSYQGQPVSSGSVTFFDKNNQVVGSSVITAGKYKVQQVPVGAVTITVISAPPPSKVKKGTAPPDKDAVSADEGVAIPPEYGKPDKSGLTYQVKPGPQKHAIELN